MEHAKLWKRILNEGLVFEAFAVDCPILLGIAKMVEDRNLEDAIRFFTDMVITSTIIVVPWQNDLPYGEENLSPSNLGMFSIAMPFDQFYMEFCKKDGYPSGIYVGSWDEKGIENRTIYAIVIEIEKGKPTAKYYFSLKMTPDGKYAGDFKTSKLNSKEFLADKEWGNPAYATQAEYLSLKEKILGLESDLKMSLEKIGVLYAGTLLSCLSLLSCKNVGLKETPLDEDTNRRAIKRTKHDETYFRYHTLVVRPPGAKKDSIPIDIEVMPLHKCRGHFAEYGPEFNKGLLFGKYAGRFYVPPCMKGSKKNGVVEKDYQIAYPQPIG